MSKTKASMPLLTGYLNQLTISGAIDSHWFGLAGSSPICGKLGLIALAPKGQQRWRRYL